jgi:GDP/UDP-N,N'-diacetylbacillosamine 2-epimerase (hydrolysing)
MKKRKIIVVTGARSEYDIVSPVLEKLRTDTSIDLGLIVTGSHLSEKFGNTIKFIEQDGYRIDARIQNLVESNEKIARIQSLGNQIKPLAEAFSNLQPDIVLVAGDREEAISVTMTAAFMDIPAAHLAGGDIAKDGNIDNSIRYAASKFAHIHFTLLEQHSQTLLKLGEDNWRIHCVGNPALDKFIQTAHLSKQQISDHLKFDVTNEDFLLVVYHPIITEFDSETEKVGSLLSALKRTGLKCIINSPNSDAGHDAIVKAYNSFGNNNGKFHYFKNLPRDVYVNLMRHASCMVGNSSSGIIEAPSLGLPVVNTGSRQVGRIHAENVRFCSMESGEIEKTIAYWLNGNERAILRGMKNPYGDGNSSEKIVKVLKEIDINSKLIHKNITY